MALFRKKTDPLDQREQALNRRIAELQAEIARLNQAMESEQPAARRPSVSSPFSPSRQPSHEPVFESMPPRPVPAEAPEKPGASDLGLRRGARFQPLRRLKERFVDPPPANEKLVNYLAAGSIQGLRPLRYERRVARNRIIFVCVVLGLILWGVLIVFWQTRQ